jgi:hypothetical protein
MCKTTPERLLSMDHYELEIATCYAQLLKEAGLGGGWVFVGEIG